MSALLEIKGLRIELLVDGRLRPVIHDVSLQIAGGEALGLVGESGSGKSMTARAVIGLLPSGNRVSGEISFDGRSRMELSRAELRSFRARDVAMIFQDPRAHINPVRRIGDFLCEALISCHDVRLAQARRLAAETLADTGVDNVARRMRQYPHELSGGLLQRVMIAAALLTKPRMIIADEPTTALDVTTQSEVMAILSELRSERGLSMLFITHDLDLAAAVCDRTAVMYAGSIVEDRDAADLHADPLHPYTRALASSRPSITRRLERLAAIEGRPLAAYEAPAGCAFAPRCPHVREACRVTRPALRELHGGRVSCLRAEDLIGELGPALQESSGA